YLEEQELSLVKQGNCKPVITLPRKAACSVPEEAVDPLIGFVPKIREATAQLRASFDNAVGGTMVLIPSGDFIMGSDAPDAQPNEQPLTPVSLSTYYIGQHPVTNAQYER